MKPTVTKSNLPPVNDPEAHAAQQEVFSTVRGGSALMAGRLFTYACRLAITFLLARMLGAEQYGLYNLAVSAAAIGAGVALFGMDTTLTRQIAIFNKRDDQEGIWGSLQIAFGTVLFVSVALGTGLFALAYPIATLVFHDVRLAPLLQVSSVIIPLLTTSDVLAGATRGFKNMRDTVLAQNLLQPAVRLSMIAVIALLGLNQAWAIAAFGFSDLCASLLLLFLLNKRFPLKRSLANARRDTRQVIGFALPLWLSDLLITFRNNIEILLLGTLYTAKGVGIFAIVANVTLLSNMFHNAMTQSARPRIAELYDQGKTTQLKQLYITTTRWVMMVNIPMILIIVLFPVQLISIFGKGFVEGAPALVVIAFVNLLHVSTGMCGAMLEMTGHNRMKLTNTFIRVGVSILSNLILIPRLGVMGAALATLIHEAVANLLPMVQLWVLYRLVPYDSRTLKPVLAGLLAGGVGLVMRTMLPPGDNAIAVVLQMVLILTIYAAALQLLGLPAEEQTMMKKLRRRAMGFFHVTE